MHPIRRYALLACAISWVLVLPLVLRGLGLIGLEPSPLWHALGALGPVSAAFILRRSADPGFRLRDLYRRQGSLVGRVSTTAGRFGTPGRARGIGGAWTAAFVLSPVLFLAIAWIVAAVMGRPVDSAALLRTASSPAWLANLLVGSVAYGFGEEPGWRGWLLPRLQEKHGAVRSTLILSAIWAVWHVPYFTYRYDFDAGTITAFYVGLLAGAFWLTFLFNSTAGSVMAVVVWHVVWNVANLVAASASPDIVIVLNALAMVLGFGVAIVWGRRDLTMQPRATLHAAGVASDAVAAHGRR